MGQHCRVTTITRDTRLSDGFLEAVKEAFELATSQCVPLYEAVKFITKHIGQSTKERDVEEALLVLREREEINFELPRQVIQVGGFHEEAPEQDEGPQQPSRWPWRRRFNK